MAAFAQHKLERFPNVEVVNASFETWQPARAEFDAIVAFAAFHWISPEARYAKTASLLRAGGSLAVVRTTHVLLPNGDEFFAEVQNDYEAILPDAAETTEGARRRPRRLKASRRRLRPAAFSAGSANIDTYGT